MSIRSLSTDYFGNLDIIEIEESEEQFCGQKPVLFTVNRNEMRDAIIIDDYEPGVENSMVVSLTMEELTSGVGKVFNKTIGIIENSAEALKRSYDGFYK